MAKYRFGEKTEEYSAKAGKKVPVWQTPKYEQSKAKAIEVIEQYQNIKEGDFWILMNETKSGDKMLYSGLIISHNACLKINDQLQEQDRFKPSCVTLDKGGYGDSLVYTYCNEDQGIYEVGEVSKANCKNAYPYAMAYKRLFDRVVLKNSKIAYDGIYSDSEADEFKQPQEAPETRAKNPAGDDANDLLNQKIDDAKKAAIVARCAEYGLMVGDLLKLYRCPNMDSITNKMFMNMHDHWQEIVEKIGVK